MQVCFVGGNRAFEFVSLGLRLESVDVAEHPAGFQALVAGDDPSVAGESGSIELQASPQGLFDLPLGLGLRPGFLLVEPAHARVFFPEPGHIGHGGSHLVAQLLLVDLGEHVAHTDGRLDRDGHLPQPARGRRRDLEQRVGSLRNVSSGGSLSLRPSSGTWYPHANAPSAPSVRNAAARVNQLRSGTILDATSSCSSASTGRSSIRKARP